MGEERYNTFDYLLMFAMMTSQYISNASLYIDVDIA